MVGFYWLRLGFGKVHLDKVLHLGPIAGLRSQEADELLPGRQEGRKHGVWRGVGHAVTRRSRWKDPDNRGPLPL